MMSESIAIAPLSTLEQYAECERLQQIIWESKAVEVVPTHLLLTFQRHGGVVLGAFAPAGQLVGFAFGFVGQVAADRPAAARLRWQHCSHELGVLRQWRGLGVGYRLKLAQRDWVRQQGLELMTWTYDPLEMPNATLNIGKLGAVCSCYLPNLYGSMADGLNAGLPSDRFEVEWWLNSAHVAQRVRTGWQRPVLETLLAEGTALVNPGTGEAERRPGRLQHTEAPQVLVEVPAHFQGLKKRDLALAREWRLHCREAFETYFAAGYSVCDLVIPGADRAPQAYYLLRQGDVADSGQ